MSEHHDEKPHVPPPSLWPLGFAIGIACVLTGLVVSWIAAAVGAAIALLFGFLWIRDVTRDLTEHETEVEAVTREVAPSAAVSEAETWEPVEDEEEPRTYPRSVFLEASTLGIGALIGGIVTLPALGFTVLPSFTNQDVPEVDLGPIDNFPEGQWIITHFNLRPEEGEVSRRVAYIRYNGLADGEPSFTIVSNRCAHLGCPVQPGGLIQPDKTKDQKASGGQDIQLTPVIGLSSFTCPCHGGSYDSEGNRTAGPPVRALDRWTYEIKNGNLVLLTNYSVSTVEGTGANAVINKYQLTGPGQWVDGPEQILYPLQPPT